jgi:hypothetical protein
MHSARALGAAALLLAVAACSDSTSTGNGSLGLSVTTKRAGALTDVTVGGGTGGAPIVITKAQLVISFIDLHPQGVATSCGLANDDGCPQMRLGPVLVDLPLDASTKTDFSANIPAGSYSGVTLEMDGVQPSDPGATAFLAANPNMQDVSFRVEGTYNGAAFVYTTSLSVAMEMPLSTPVTVGGAGGASNLTMAIDVASWFKNGSTTLDPSNSGNASIIATNIRNSFRVFEDNNRDGAADSR